MNNSRKVRGSQPALTVHRLWTTLDYSAWKIRMSEAIWTGGSASRDRTWDSGVVRCQLAEGIGSRSSAPETIYSSCFLPWTQPVSGGRPSRGCKPRRGLVESDYVWRWTTRIEPLEGSGAPHPFEQSQLTSGMSPHVCLGAADYVPRLSGTGCAQDFRSMDGKFL